MDKKKILIVDDEEAFTRAVKISLEATKAYVVRAENKGALALETAKEFNPDLILLDVVMPDLGGSDVAAQLKDDPQCKNIPVIFLTALVTNEETDSGCSQISGHPFVAKPVKGKTLVDCIERSLRNKKTGC